MGEAIGTIFAIGLLLIWWSWETPGKIVLKAKPSRLSQLLLRAGLPKTSPALVWLAMLVLAAFWGLLVLALTQTWLIALIVAGGIGITPILILRAWARARERRVAQLWPDVVDDMIAGVRAGLPLAEILSQLAITGPEELRPDFATFTSDYRVNGSFNHALDVLATRLANRDANRLFEVLRLSREVGGADLGSLLRDLGEMMRADLRTRGEIEARQSWTTNAARLAVVAPWIVLVMITTRTGAGQVYRSGQGAMVLIFGLVVSLVAYWLMRRAGDISEVGK
ncbi:hypothetical protein BK816_02610 [Boudabousia tangfeifanii]|uniref:Type II secretion system protein GspF domain-containing protein n=1 Tax=Boudabousia tangfeifanii TaxID=1912795 RepID=A0A1D9MJ46_9ACTO|nr:type II secretion system F family protein [Boudabousia tangfeifanii]AOZ72327.1 hypothetical protein BK816_02610 [Boudabousia tangfeifanii]